MTKYGCAGLTGAEEVTWGWQYGTYAPLVMSEKRAMIQSRYVPVQARSGGHNLLVLIARDSGGKARRRLR